MKYTLFLLSICLCSAMSTNIKLYKSNNENFADISIEEFIFTARVAGLNNLGDPIILLHGFPETSRMWKDLIAILDNNKYRVMAPDQRGYSKGARPLDVGLYKIDLLANDILLMADAFGYEKFHLVGHDWGSAVGWYLAGRNPDRLLTWTALSVPHMDAFISAMDNDKIQKRKSRYISFFKLPFFPEFYFKIFNYKNLRAIWTHSSEDEINDYIDVFKQKNALKASLHWYRANLSNSGEILGNIDVPTLMISGVSDIAVGQLAVDNTENYINGEYNIYKLDAGHWLIQESFSEVSSAIINHIEMDRQENEN